MWVGIMKAEEQVKCPFPVGLEHWSRVIVFTDTVTTLTPFLSATKTQCFRPKDYTKTILRLQIRISKGLGCSSIDKTMTRDLRFRPASPFQ